MRNLPTYKIKNLLNNRAYNVSECTIALANDLLAIANSFQYIASPQHLLYACNVRKVDFKKVVQENPVEAKLLRKSLQSNYARVLDLIKNTDPNKKIRNFSTIYSLLGIIDNSEFTKCYPANSWQRKGIIHAFRASCAIQLEDFVEKHIFSRADLPHSLVIEGIKMLKQNTFIDDDNVKEDKGSNVTINNTISNNNNLVEISQESKNRLSELTNRLFDK